jgi:hypothetical protein
VLDPNRRRPLNGDPMRKIVILICLLVPISAALAYPVVKASNYWLGGQAVRPVALISGAIVTPNAAQSNNFTLRATGNFTLANPANLKPGQTINFWVTQDGIGHRIIKWGPGYQSSGGPGSMVLSMAANAKDMISCQSDTATTMTCSIQIGIH